MCEDGGRGQVWEVQWIICGLLGRWRLTNVPLYRGRASARPWHKCHRSNLAFHPLLLSSSTSQIFGTGIAPESHRGQGSHSSEKKHQLYLYARSTFLTATAAMAEGTQLFEGAHLTGGDPRFCRESSKSRGFWGVKSSIFPCESFQDWKTSLSALSFFIVHINTVVS